MSIPWWSAILSHLRLSIPLRSRRLVFIKPITTKAVESHALITTKNGREINLHLISSGTVATSQVDFLVEFRWPQSLLVGHTATSSLWVPETKSVGSRPSAQNRQLEDGADPIAAALTPEKAVAAPSWQGNSLQVSVGESSELDHQMLLGFSVLNNSPQAIELLPPQIVLNGPSASGKGKEIRSASPPRPCAQVRSSELENQVGSAGTGNSVGNPSTLTTLSMSVIDVTPTIRLSLSTRRCSLTCR